MQWISLLLPGFWSMKKITFIFFEIKVWDWIKTKFCFYLERAQSLSGINVVNSSLFDLRLYFWILLRLFSWCFIIQVKLTKLIAYSWQLDNHSIDFLTAFKKYIQNLVNFWSHPLISKIIMRSFWAVIKSNGKINHSANSTLHLSHTSGIWNYLCFNSLNSGLMDNFHFYFPHQQEVVLISQQHTKGVLMFFLLEFLHQVSASVQCMAN